MTCRAIELLTEIREQNAAILTHLENLDTLAEKRAKNRERMAAVRAAEKSLQEVPSASVRAQDSVREQKEDEKGKETFPPAPPIEKREKQKKQARQEQDACAREDSHYRQDLRTKRIAEVRAYNAELGGDIDAEYFVDYYADRWPKTWQARLRNWLKEGKPSGRLPPEKAPATSAATQAAELYDRRRAALLASVAGQGAAR